MSNDPECNGRAYGKVQGNLGTRCGNSSAGLYNPTTFVESCCVIWDTCGANGVCKRTGSDDTYYLGGCTDPAFKDPVCPLLCNNARNDVVYQPALGVWSCCGAEGNDCSDPMNGESLKLDWRPADFPGPVKEVFSAPATTSVASDVPVTSGSSISLTGSTSLTTPAEIQTTSLESSELSTGAKAGIGVGAAIGGLLLIGLITAVVLLCRRREKHQNGPSPSEDQHGMEHAGQVYGKEHEGSPGVEGSSGIYEVESSRSPVEMDGLGRTYELLGSGVQEC
ncbi:uncharacterized protein RCC_11210 [Ramularia collo-cygni]|uniref:WSC domain-containing protein n=1 Tax=Ramularia collo-cygni TaxID=112498 RepID=A0A2D3VSD2_9PEZI|nr:uncharacterized protein RCC_11210 [Ramularia collo-cygni]CZT25478.1 uncharacterized protein RCC_11210 [Ramularia collo-cygni]